MILHYLRGIPDSLAPRRACSVEAMIEAGASGKAIIRSTESSSAGAKVLCVPGRVVQNRRTTETSSAETAGSFSVDVGAERPGVPAG
jgi:hypothetical protein